MRFVPNLRFRSQLVREAEYKRTFEELGTEVRDVAQRIAREEAYDTGEYMRGIVVVLEPGEDGGLIARVNATDPKSNWIEYGVRGRPGKAVLRRALEEVIGTSNIGVRFATT